MALILGLVTLEGMYDRQMVQHVRSNVESIRYPGPSLGISITTHSVNLRTGRNGSAGDVKGTYASRRTTITSETKRSRDSRRERGPLCRGLSRLLTQS